MVLDVTAHVLCHSNKEVRRRLDRNACWNGPCCKKVPGVDQAQFQDVHVQFQGVSDYFYWLKRDTVRILCWDSLDSFLFSKRRDWMGCAQSGSGGSSYAKVVSQERGGFNFQLQFLTRERRSGGQVQSAPHQVFEGYPQLGRQCQRSGRPSASLVSLRWNICLPRLTSSSKMLSVKLSGMNAT